MSAYFSGVFKIEGRPLIAANLADAILALEEMNDLQKLKNADAC